MFLAARAVFLSMREREDFVCAEKLSAAEQIKPDCCHTPAVVSTLLTPLPVSCPSTTPQNYIYIIHNSDVDITKYSHKSVPTDADIQSSG